MCEICSKLTAEISERRNLTITLKCTFKLNSDFILGLDSTESLELGGFL